MSEANIVQELYARLAQDKLQARIVSGTHLQELRDDLKQKHTQGLFDQDFYEEWVKALVLGPLAKAASSRSLIIVGVPQPQYRVRFNWRGESHSFIIPPTYFHHMDEPVKKTLEEFLSRYHYSLSEILLPKKLLTVRSGLGRYGRNNLCYIQELGTFHRLLTFSSDMPVPQDHWYELRMLDECRDCHACERACPSGAISNERVLLHAERCITFHNESERDFPDWIRPEWHNVLVGCMLCQKACPVNQLFIDWIEDTCEFTESETTQIINGIPVEQFQPETVQKLKDIYFDGFINTFGRNLKALMVKKGVINSGSLSDT